MSLAIELGLQKSDTFTLPILTMDCQGFKSYSNTLSKENKIYSYILTDQHLLSGLTNHSSSYSHEYITRNTLCPQMLFYTLSFTEV